MRRWFLTTTALVCTLALLLAGQVPAAETTVGSAADLVPGSTALYVEFTHPSDAVNLVMDHPMTKQVIALASLSGAYDTPQFKKFQAAVKKIEEQLGQEWRPALENATAGGITLAIDPETNGVVLLIQAQDESTLPKLHQALIDLAKQEASNRGQDLPLQDREYRELKAYRTGDAIHATFGKWFLLSNKSDLAKNVADRFLDGTKDSLAAQEEFQQARKHASAGATGWAYLKVSVLRDAGVAEKVFSGKTDNPAAELLAGGIMTTLSRTPYVTGSLFTSGKELKLVISSPHLTDWVPPEREFFFGPDGKGAAPAVAEVPNTLLSITTYRDLSAMWLAAAELFDENVVAEMTKAESGLATFFPGRDFARDVLGAVKPQMQLIVARQDFSKTGLPEPSIKLPAGAFVFELKDPQMQTQLKVAFESIVGFGNIVGGQNGQPPMELKIEKHGDGRIISAQYVIDATDEKAKGKINYNFTPSLGQVGNQVILGSSRELVQQLMDLGAKASNAASGVNSQVQLDVQVGKTMLADNLEHLIAQNMLEKGHTREEAEQEINGLVYLLGWVKSTAVRLTKSDTALNLEFSLQLK